MTTPLNRDSAVPLYVQLAETLRAEIAAGTWAPGERIPSENELTAAYGLARMTVRGVLTTLVGEGLLERVPGKGTFVARERIAARSPAYAGIREQLEQMGYETTTELLDCGLEVPPATVGRLLGLAPRAEVHAIRWLRRVHGEPISVHTSYIPADSAPDLDQRDTVGEQLCVVLEKHYGLVIREVEEELEATAATRDEARALGLRAGQPVLLLKDLIGDGTRAFEYSKIVFRGDRISLRFSYSR